MRKNRSAVLAVALAMVFTTAAVCQTPDRTTTGTTGTMTGTTTGTTVTGRITSVDPTANTVTVDTPQGSMTFTTDTSTHFMSGTSGGTTGTMMTISGLKTGDQVRVMYSGTGTTRTATRVEVMPAGTTTGSTYGTGTTGSSYGSTGTMGTTTGSMGMSVSGRVVSVDPATNMIVVETSNGRETFRTTTTSRFMANDRNLRLNDLHVGDQVTLNFSGTGTDRTITTVNVTSGSYAASTGTTGSYDANRTTGTESDEDTLPATASPLPLIGLAGLAAFALAAGLRMVRRRA